MEQYVKGTPADAQDIVDFADFIFSKDAAPHDFSQLLPKLYGDGADTQQYHYLVKEEGRIKAMVCVLPVHLNVAGIELKLGCIGTVSVHPRARGKGYMKKLMNMVIEDIQSEGYSLSLLGGQRQRYEYFGYEPAGIKLNFTLTEDNIRHKYGGLDASGISFEPLSSNSSQLEDAYQLYEQGIVSGARSKEQFASIMRSWNAQTLVILHHHKFVGYIAIKKDGGNVHEIELVDQALLPIVCKALIAYKKVQALHFTVPAYDRDKISLLGDASEFYSTSYDHNYMILDYAKVIEAFMSCKARNVKLQDGKFVIRIEGCETVEIVVQDNQVIVNKHAEGTGIQADLVLSKREATAGIFSSLSEFANWNSLSRNTNIPQGWFPLPLYVPPADGC